MFYNNENKVTKFPAILTFFFIFNSVFCHLNAIILKEIHYYIYLLS